jgi:hypothetical protein
MDETGIYRCVASSVEGFVQQLAVSYLPNAYRFYVMGFIREGKDPRATDERILEKYGIAVSKHTRYRRKKAELANLQYLRHDRTFVILATHGEHPFLKAEKASIRDATRVPIKYKGYALSHKRGHSSVRIERETHRGLKAYFEDIAAKRTMDELFREFAALPYEPYAPVRGQLFEILRAVNHRRKLASLCPLPHSAIRVRRRKVSVFQP